MHAISLIGSFPACVSYEHKSLCASWSNDASIEFTLEKTTQLNAIQNVPEAILSLASSVRFDSLGKGRFCLSGVFVESGRAISSGN